MTEQSNTQTRIHSLNDKWNMYYHLPRNNDWSLESYPIIRSDINDMETMILINEHIHDAVIKQCMLFIMKSGITPLWEDPQNRTGGCFSYKVGNKYIVKIWKTMTYLLLGNSLAVKSAYNKYINGITLSPKKNFCIIKIWLSTTSLQDPKIITNIENLSQRGCLFKKHEL